MSTSSIKFDKKSFKMKVKNIFNDVLLIKNNTFDDSRGFFIELFNLKIFKDKKIPHEFVQDNLSFSLKKNTIRGLHYQKPPFEQSKLISLISGSIQDVFIDIRPGSRNFGKYKSIILDQFGDSLYIPKGYLHGFCTLSDDTIIKYKVDNFYDKNSETGICWDDKFLNIDWNLSTDNPILSEKDSSLLSWEEFIDNLELIND